MWALADQEVSGSSGARWFREPRSYRSGRHLDPVDDELVVFGSRSNTQGTSIGPSDVRPPIDRVCCLWSGGTRMNVPAVLDVLSSRRPACPDELSVCGRSAPSAIKHVPNVSAVSATSSRSVIGSTTFPQLGDYIRTSGRISESHKMATMRHARDSALRSGHRSEGPPGTRHPPVDTKEVWCLSAWNRAGIGVGPGGGPLRSWNPHSTRAMLIAYVDLLDELQAAS